MVHGSRVYLEQAFGNLLSNADKYSPPDAPIEVTVVATEGGELQIAVRDHGPGLSDTDRDRIFEPYYRGEEARRRATGFGLGLAVSRQLVEAMGGRLWLESPGDGACFIIALPSEPDATDEPSRGERSRSEPVDGAEAGQRGMDLMPA
jgi:signal transduction histidine kinase